ncbi:gag-pol polyprotein [Gossypium australe]|uniref:Gag-pol polyprotein n=1 Tax=Gossypium australe TaxID=47621 RepID=A0A5B6X1I0_9ROSI|nr:gag-pol polyprotein [Gossypium australe]
MMKAKENVDLPDFITNSGSTYFYICTKFVEGLSLKVIYFEANVLMTNLLGQSTIVNRVIKSCLLVFGEHTFLADLLLLSFHEFDAILGLE